MAQLVGKECLRNSTQHRRLQHASFSYFLTCANLLYKNCPFIACLGKQCVAHHCRNERTSGLQSSRHISWGQGKERKWAPTRARLKRHRCHTYVLMNTTHAHAQTNVAASQLYLPNVHPIKGAEPAWTASFFLTRPRHITASDQHACIHLQESNFCFWDLVKSSFSARPAKKSVDSTAGDPSQKVPRRFEKKQCFHNLNQH